MSYKQMTAADIAALRELIGDDERVFAGRKSTRTTATTS